MTGWCDGDRVMSMQSWGDWLRNRRRDRRRRRTVGVLGGTGLGLVLASCAMPRVPFLLWNASASAPIGLYRVRHPAFIRRGDLVVASLPRSARKLAAERGYLPSGVPLVKHVVGLPGDIVCARGVTITLDGRQLATRRRRDRAGRPMPWWRGCLRLGGDRVFLAMPTIAASFDGRYFDVSDRSDILGTAYPLRVG